MSALRRQLELGLWTPGDHAEIVHRGPRHGTVLFWERQSGDQRRWVKVRPGDDLPALANALRGAKDAYFSVNQFRGWREVRLLQSLRALYVDIDGNQDVDLALDALAAALLPPPTFVVRSGRGLHLYWLLEPTPAQALPVWQRMQDAVLKALRSVGADPACRDCTRVLRLAGTINSKTEQEAYGLIVSGVTWDMHSLADEILGHRKPGRPKKSAVISDINAAAARAGRKSVLAGSIYGWWHTVYRDLVSIVDRRFHNRLPDGQRDKFLFLHAVALSWFAQPDAIESEVLKVGRLITDFDDRTILQTMAPVLERRNQADAGHKIVWQGQERDPRYWFKAESLREVVGSEIVNEYAHDLRALAPAEVIKERKRERDAGRDRVAEGRYKKRHADDETREKARRMALEGRTQKEIADELDVTDRTLRNWLRG